MTGAGQPEAWARDRHGACRGRDEFSSADLARHSIDILGRNVAVV